MTKKRMHRLALAGSLLLAAVGPLALAAPADAVTLPAPCSGPTLNSVSSTGFTIESVLWVCADSGSGHSAATGTINGSSFNGTWYDNFCSGDVNGIVTGPVFVGVLTNVTCGSAQTVRSGVFAFAYSGLVGEMTVAR
jgi:hypothetical protein